MFAACTAVAHLGRRLRLLIRMCPHALSVSCLLRTVFCCVPPHKTVPFMVPSQQLFSSLVPFAGLKRTTAPFCLCFASALSCLCFAFVALPPCVIIRSPHRTHHLVSPPKSASLTTRALHAAGNLSGTRMVEYTTEVRVPLYVWMDPYFEFQ